MSEKTKEETKQEWKDREVGAIWEKEKSLFILMDGNAFTATKNKFKSKDNQPDWRIYKQNDNGSPQKVKKERVVPTPQEPVDNDDVPF